MVNTHTHTHGGPWSNPKKNYIQSPRHSVVRQQHELNVSSGNTVNVTGSDGAAGRQTQNIYPFKYDAVPPESEGEVQTLSSVHHITR